MLIIFAISALAQDVVTWGETRSKASLSSDAFDQARAELAQALPLHRVREVDVLGKAELASASFAFLDAGVQPLTSEEREALQAFVTDGGVVLAQMMGPAAGSMGKSFGVDVVEKYSDEQPVEHSVDSEFLDGLFGEVSTFKNRYEGHLVVSEGSKILVEDSLGPTMAVSKAGSGTAVFYTNYFAFADADFSVGGLLEADTDNARLLANLASRRLPRLTVGVAGVDLLEPGLSKALPNVTFEPFSEEGSYGAILVGPSADIDWSAAAKDGARVILLVDDATPLGDLTATAIKSDAPSASAWTSSGKWNEAPFGPSTWSSIWQISVGETTSSAKSLAMGDGDIWLLGAPEGAPSLDGLRFLGNALTHQDGPAPPPSDGEPSAPGPTNEWRESVNEALDGRPERLKGFVEANGSNPSAASLVQHASAWLSSPEWAVDPRFFPLGEHEVGRSTRRSMKKAGVPSAESRWTFKHNNLLWTCLYGNNDSCHEANWTSGPFPGLWSAVGISVDATPETTAALMEELGYKVEIGFAPRTPYGRQVVAVGHGLLWQFDYDIAAKNEACLQVSSRYKP